MMGKEVDGREAELNGKGSCDGGRLKFDGERCCV